MARWYHVTFVGPKGKTITTRGQGNTRSSAERSARHRLKDDHKVDPKQFWARSFTFIPENERTEDV